MSDTPRALARWKAELTFQQRFPAASPAAGMYVFCEDLERELAAANARIAELERERDAAVVANCPRLCAAFCNEYQTHVRIAELERGQEQEQSK